MIKELQIGNRIFQLQERTYVMGILNVTPDSFSDGGDFRQVDQALFHVEQMIGDGADLIDVGGESTRPEYTMVSEEEEIQRVVPVIEAIEKRFDIPISIDTYKSTVAREAILAGANMVNDIWGLKYDSNMAKVVAKYQVPVCIMHNRQDKNYVNFNKEIMEDLSKSLEIAEKAGIPKDRMIIDPGVGFGKTYENNIEVMAHLEQFLQFDLPILLGTSRKSVIGLTLDLPVEEREEGTIATSVIGVMKGCHFIRVHNVKGNVRAIRMAEKILQCE